MVDNRVLCDFIERKFNIKLNDIEKNKMNVLIRNKDEKSKFRKFLELYGKNNFCLELSKYRNFLYKEGRGRVELSELENAYNNKDYNVLKCLLEEMFLHPIDIKSFLYQVKKKNIKISTLYEIHKENIGMNIGMIIKYCNLK